jgi:hypothetical protein
MVVHGLLIIDTHLCAQHHVGTAYDPKPGIERIVADEVGTHRRTWLDSLTTLSCKSMCKLVFSLCVVGREVEHKMTVVSSVQM